MKKLVTERSNFYDGFDKENYYKKVVDEYISLAMDRMECIRRGCEPSVIKVPHNVVDCHRLIIEGANEFMSKYRYFVKLSSVLTALITDIDGQDSNTYRELVDAKEKFSQSYHQVLKLKDAAKYIPMDNKYYSAVSFVIGQALTDIDTELTMGMAFYGKGGKILSDYSDILLRSNISLEDDMTANLTPSSIPVSGEEMNNMINQYGERIVSVVESDTERRAIINVSTEWLNDEITSSCDEYIDVIGNTTLEARRDAIRERLSTRAGGKDVAIIGGRMGDLKQMGETSCKIVIVADADRATPVRVLSTDDSLSKYLSHAKVMREYDILPEPLASKVRNGELIMEEIILPL